MALSIVNFRFNLNDSCVEKLCLTPWSSASSGGSVSSRSANSTVSSKTFDNVSFAAEQRYIFPPAEAESHVNIMNVFHWQKLSQRAGSCVSHMTGRCIHLSLVIFGKYLFIITPGCWWAYQRVHCQLACLNEKWRFQRKKVLVEGHSVSRGASSLRSGEPPLSEGSKDLSLIVWLFWVCSTRTHNNKTHWFQNSPDAV